MCRLWQGSKLPVRVFQKGKTSLIVPCYGGELAEEVIRVRMTS